MKFLDYLKETIVVADVATNTAKSGFEPKTKTSKKRKCGCKDEENCEECEETLRRKGKDK